VASPDELEKAADALHKTVREIEPNLISVFEE
jgi:hypothetical protein